MAEKVKCHEKRHRMITAKCTFYYQSTKVRSHVGDHEELTIYEFFIIQNNFTNKIGNMPYSKL
jgi:hypothetical protein